MTTFLLIAGGLGLLALGGELLVRGASRLAAAMRVSPLVIGLTVVAFGTSMPELTVSFIAALEARADLALGNAVGSNTFNLLGILGLSALIVPLAVSPQILRFDLPVMIASAGAVLLAGWDGRIAAWEGGVFVGLLVLYTRRTILVSRKELGEAAPSAERPERPPDRPWGAGLICLLGLGALILGSHWLVDGSVRAARAFGVGELVIGLTIVAIGTSMPEVAASVVAAIRGQRDIAVGNVVGSNIFNMLGVLGVSAGASDSGISVAESAREFDIPVMIAVSLVCAPMMYTARTISRWEGALLLCAYSAYTAYLILQSTGAPVPRPAAVLWYGIVPAAFLAFLVGAAFWTRERARVLPGATPGRR